LTRSIDEHVHILETKGMSEALVTQWTALGDKLVDLAEAFPGGHYDGRPTASVRSVAEQLRHVAFWNEFALQSLRGEPADGAANELPAAEFGTKAAIVRALRESFDAVTRELTGTARPLAEAGADTVTTFIQHGAEHYGQLVVYARLRGIVPPTSRDP
jgi:uncharacterized damage-inducible protein DinB